MASRQALQAQPEIGTRSGNQAHAWLVDSDAPWIGWTRLAHAIGRRRFRWQVFGRRCVPRQQRVGGCRIAGPRRLLPRAHGLCAVGGRVAGQCVRGKLVGERRVKAERISARCPVGWRGIWHGAVRRRVVWSRVVRGRVRERCPLSPSVRNGRVEGGHVRERCVARRVRERWVARRVVWQCMTGQDFCDRCVGGGFGQRRLVGGPAGEWCVVRGCVSAQRPKDGPVGEWRVGRIVGEWWVLGGSAGEWCVPGGRVSGQRPVGGWGIGQRSAGGRGIGQRSAGGRGIGQRSAGGQGGWQGAMGSRGGWRCVVGWGAGQRAGEWGGCGQHLAGEGVRRP